jgi:transposase-like protein
MKCPECSSKNIKKNGHIHNGKQRYACNNCGRQFVEFPENIIISDEMKILIDKLLLERLALRAIVRITGVSLGWLQKYINDKYKNIPHKVDVMPKSKGRFGIECDELWSFVFNKKNKQWVWLAIDRDTSEIGCSRSVGFITTCLSSMYCFLYRFLGSI